MLNAQEISQWIRDYPGCLKAYSVGDRVLFPIYGPQSLTTKVIAYVAIASDRFPESGEMGLDEGLSQNEWFYRLVFDGRRNYSKREVDAMLTRASEQVA